MDRILTRISNEIRARNPDPSSLVIVGIRKRGDILAKKIAEKIMAATAQRVATAGIDITFYRDDLHLKAYKYVVKREIQPDFVDKNVILVDDVIFTGRTARAALDALIEGARPRSIQLAVLIDRGGRELPIQPNYVGRILPDDLGKNVDVSVYLDEVDSEDEVLISWT